MSRIGKKPIALPAGVKIEQEKSVITVSGPKGALSRELPPGVTVNIDQGVMVVQSIADNRKEKAYHGLMRTLLDNMVTGVSRGFEKSLEISGVGYRAEVGGRVMKLLLGYSHPIEYEIPEGMSIKVDKQVNIVVGGIDKELVGKVAAEIRSLKKPEPYKGKGIHYVGEKIRRKAGKSAGA